MRLENFLCDHRVSAVPTTQGVQRRYPSPHFTAGLRRLNEIQTQMCHLESDSAGLWPLSKRIHANGVGLSPTKAGPTGALDPTALLVRYVFGARALNTYRPLGGTTFCQASGLISRCPCHAKTRTSQRDRPYHLLSILAIYPPVVIAWCYRGQRHLPVTGCANGSNVAAGRRGR